MNKYSKIAILIMCGVSLVLSVVAVCVACYHTPDLGFDYQGVIVGVLSLLATVLIGWNIYNVVDFNKKISEIERKSSVLQKISDNSDKISISNKVEIEQSISFIYYHLLGFAKYIPLEYEYVDHAIKAIMYASMIGKYDLCNSVIDIILTSVKHPENVVISEDYKTRLLLEMNNIQCPENIARLKELVTFVSRFKSE